MAILVPILIGLSIGLVGWTVVRLVSGSHEDRRKLKQRLATESSVNLDTFGTSRRSVALQTDIGGLDSVLVKLPPLEAVYLRLIQAYPGVTLARFLAIAGALAIVLFAMVGVFLNSLVLGLLAGALGSYVPFLMLSGRRARRQRQLADQLPEALDFLSRILKAGHSLSTGLQMMADELPEPLAGEFRRCYDAHSLGLPLEDALKDMAARIESTDFAFFITAVLIQRQTGGDLSAVLANISGMIRQRVRLQNHVKAKTAEGRLTGYILVAFPAILFLIFYILNPKYAGVMLNDSTGLTLLGVAFALQMLGLYAIRKITTVRV